MDVAQALADLTEISTQIEQAVVFSPAGAVEGSTLVDEARATALARTALDVLAAAAGVRPDGPPVTRLQAELREGGLYVVRESERVIAATTVPHATPGLVFYDLRTCLRALEAAPQAKQERQGERGQQERKPPKRRQGGADAAS
jgi:hypothetical protein